MVDCFILRSDLVIAQRHKAKDIDVLAREICLLPEEVDLYGKKKAKVSLDVLKRLEKQKNGHYVVVTGYAQHVCIIINIIVLLF